MRNLNDAVKYEADMIADGWTPVRHEGKHGDSKPLSVFERLQAMNETVTAMFDDELEEPCDYKELAHALSEELSWLATAMGFPATDFLRSVNYAPRVTPFVLRDAA